MIELILWKIVAAFSSLVLLDFVWINFLAKKLYFKELKNHVEIKKGKMKIRKLTALLVYVVLSIGIVIFAPNTNFMLVNLISGLLFGFVIYGVYDLTNYSIMKDYSLKLAIVDITWGTLLCGIVSLIISSIHLLN